MTKRPHGFYDDKDEPPAPTRKEIDAAARADAKRAEQLERIAVDLQTVNRLLENLSGYRKDNCSQAEWENVQKTRDGDDERDFVGRSPPHFSRLFAAQIGIIDLDVARKLVGGIALAHDLHQLLFDEPGGIAFHTQLAGELEGGDI